MKFSVGRYDIKITPETEVEEAYIEEVLGLESEGDYVKLVRSDVIGLSRIAYLQTLKVKMEDEESPNNAG